MYASVRRYRVDPQRSPEVIKQMTEEFPPLIEELGEIVAYFLVEGSDGALATITICQDNAVLEEINRSVTKRMTQYLAQRILGEEENHRFLLEVEEPIYGPLHEGISDLTSREDPKEVKEVAQEEILRVTLGSVPELLSVEQVCKVVGMSKAWVYRHIASGEIPSVRLGGTIKVRSADLEEYLHSSNLANNRANGGSN
jgi:excisionase family DNA binding protein